MVEAGLSMKNRRLQLAFRRQALLIAAPVVILSATALYSLHLDKASILQNARSDADSIAPFLARNCAKAIAEGWIDGSAVQGSTILKAGNEYSAPEIFEGIVTGKTILAPIDYEPIPSPPAWPQSMLPRGRQLLLAAEAAIFRKKDAMSGRAALAALKSADSPEAAANAELNLLLLEGVRNDASNAARSLTSLARRCRIEATPSGTPLADIALLRALHCADPQSLPEVLRVITGRMKNYPSFLTADLVAAAVRAQPEQSALSNEWRSDEETRRLIHAFLRQSRDSAHAGEFRLQDGGRTYLVLCTPEIGIHVAVIPARWVEKRIIAALKNSGSPIPSYAGVELQIGSLRWDLSLGNSLTNKPLSGDLLASTSGRIRIQSKLSVPVVVFKEKLRRLELGATAERLSLKGDINSQATVPLAIDHPFMINLILTDPNVLYAPYRQRLWLIAGLVLLAAAAAGFGLAGAWRAFQRQTQLAEMTSNFVSSVSHELRAPLASMRLMAESLDQGRIDESEKQKRYFHLIVQECARLSSLVENVLDFSRIRQERKNYEFEPVDALALVRQTFQLMTPIAAERQVQLEIAVPQLPHRILEPRWDGQAVQQTIVNLIDNAIKHSPPDATVKLECTVSDTHICICVSDEGPGIPEKERERIFEPFYRRGSELRRETKGIGIGLSIVKHVAEAHGARIIVESKMGKGSCFRLELPFEISR
jgi:signal transduction histidine kinase